MKCSWIRGSTDRYLACEPRSAEVLAVNLRLGVRTSLASILLFYLAGKLYKHGEPLADGQITTRLPSLTSKKREAAHVLEFTQIGVPPNRYSGHYRGWIEAYWTPMKEVFERGKISEKTRRRVRQSRDQRIKTGKFRRKIAMKM